MNELAFRQYRKQVEQRMLEEIIDNVGCEYLGLHFRYS